MRFAIKLLSLMTLTLSARILAAPPATGGDAAPPLGPPHTLKLPMVDEETLSNGLKIVVLEDHSQPALWLRLAIPAGSIRDPQDRVGLANMTAALLDKGTTSRSETQIADMVDSLGASLGASSDDDFLTVSASGLSPYADTLFTLMSDIALHPTFPAEEMERQRTILLNELTQALSNPDTLESAALARAVYGAHPYGDFSLGTPKTLTAITQRDLERFHSSCFVPRGSTLFVVGDITVDHARTEAQSVFGDWIDSRLPALAPAPERSATSSERPQVLIVDRPGAAQTQVGIGALTSGYSDPMRIPGQVATAVLGGGEFDNRLTQEVRVKRGLTYGIYSYIARQKQAGAFMIMTSTKNASTGEVIKLALDEARRMASQPVGADELAQHKTFLNGSFALGAATPRGMLTDLTRAVLYGGGPEDLTAYTDHISDVTAEQVKAVMDGLSLSHPSIVLVGDAKAIMSQVAPLGDVTVVEPAELDLLSPTLKSAAK